jgi:hypothetical protein
MDPRKNPYTPGAGTPPAELAGREEVKERGSLALDRIKDNRSARGVILYGLRGVGKTVLLNTLVEEAESKGLVVSAIEAPENQSLPAILAPVLRASLYKLKRGKEAKAHLLKAFKALKSFIGALKFTYQDIDVSIDFDKEEGVADSGNLERDLGDLFIVVGEAAKERSTAVLLAIDEIQYIKENQLEALMAALHRVGQKQLPVIMFAAGLPQLLGQMGKAKSYAERLFEFVPIGKLPGPAAEDAVRKPAEEEGVAYTREAITAILKQTQGYPYFLQEWGKHCWNIAANSLISEHDVQKATEMALAELDASFFRVRLERLKPSEKSYLRAMAELGPGPHRSGDIAEKMSRTVNAVAPIRSSLITKGMIYSSSYGETGFTVPLFDEFMKRMMS